MKRTILFTLLLILGISLCSNVYAQIDVTIGDGTTANTTSGTPTPYGTYYKNFRQQYLVRASEIEDQGGGAGNINSLAFNVQALNTCSPMPNYTIRLKQTTQTALTTTFEEGEYQTVFVQNDFLPVLGWNVHTFTAPFVWDGTSNLLVDIYTSLIPGTWTQNASAFYSTTTFNSSLRFQNDTADASTATTGSTSVNRSNIRFNMQAAVVTNPPNPAQLVFPLDGATAVMSSATLSWASGGGAPSGYKVYFGTAANPPFIQNTTETTYAPTMGLNTTYYWKVVPFNAIGDAVNCPVWSFTTGGAVVFMTNGQQSVPDGTPYSFFDSGGPDGQYQNSENYTFTFSAANPTSIIQVMFTAFNTENNYDKLKIYNGPDTSAPQIGPANGYMGTDLPPDIIGSNAVTFVFTSDGSVPRDGWAATVSAINLPHDLGAQSILGNLTPSVGSPSTYSIAVKNNGANTETAYTVKLMSTDNVMLASVPGTSIAPQATNNFELVWTPSAIGALEIWGEVVLTGDVIATNNQTPHLTVNVQAAGVVAVTIGDGSQTGRMPMDFLWKNSLSESIYLATEMNIGGLITGIQYYNDFTYAGGLMAKPTKIWMGEVTQTDLAGGWIPSTELVSVFDGVVDYPTGANDILVTLTTPYAYGGGNLVVMVQRPMDTAWFSGVNFRTQTVGTSRTLLEYSDSDVFDPAAPPTDTAPQGMFPKTTFMLITEGMGSISGTVYVGTTPLAGATVTVAGTPLTYTTGANGTYSFPYVEEGARQVTATKHGYTSVTQTVTVVEDQTVVQNFTIALLPQVTVSGRIVGSDAPNVGIAGATITLSGYEPYTATTNATGNFTIANVYASQTYNYVATATGYQNATGTVAVGTANVNMGDVTVNERAFPPYGVQAVVNAAATQVAVSWQPPNPNAQGITEDFEGAAFPPTNWTQVITDTSAAGTSGVLPTWCPMGEITLDPPILPHGATQAGLWWSYNHQDEWLITPQFVCPPEASLTFWSYVFLGSEEDDHYNVNVSTDNGATWTTLWDATAQTGGWNYYTTPIVVDFSAYSGQQIKIAWQATDPPSDDGLWYVWFIDDISISSPTQTFQFPASQLAQKSAGGSTLARSVVPGLPTSRARVNNPGLQEPSLTVAPTNPERVFMGYRVYRLLAQNQDNQTLWTQLTPANITPTSYTDTAWAPLAPGVYKYAVKAAYTNGVLSNPAFSSPLDKDMMGTLAGLVTDFGTGTPIAGAVVTAGTYTGTTNATGHYSFPVYQANYTVTCSKAGYQLFTQPDVQITGLQTMTLNIAMMEIAFPAYNVVATEAPNYSNVVLTWSEPGTAETGWLHYDSGENDNSIGLTAGGDLLVAIRYPASALTMYAGASLQTMKLWAAGAGTYTLHVWTGGDATAPGTLVVQQPFTPGVDEYSSVNLTTPVQITGTEELWFGYNVNHAAGVYPAGMDAGPCVNGFGNMLFNAGVWGSLFDLADFDTNWNIQGFVGFAPPTAAPTKLTPLVFNAEIYKPVSLSASGVKKNHVALSSTEASQDRSLVGYKVWRLLAANQGNEALWTPLTPTTITALTLTDNAWQPLPSGVYKFAVKAVYTNNLLANASFSNEVHKGMMGVLTGTVTDFGTGAPVAGATITAGTYTGTSNANGVYSFPVYQGVHTVTATKLGYQPFSQANVSVTGLLTTTLNIAMVEIAFPPYNVVATEAANFSNVAVTWSAPDPNALPVETFESGNFNSFAWVMGGVAPWTIDNTTAHNGINSARSGVITHSQASTIEVSRNVIVAGNVSFWSKTSCEANYDGLTFYIDGVEMGSWSGTMDWTEASYPVGLGTHVFKWEYSKDTSVNTGSDCAWIDDISFPVSSDAAKGSKKLLAETMLSDSSTDNSNMDRSLVGYKVWRLLAANQGNEATWTSLTPATITAVSYTDNAWQPLPSGVYKFAVKAVYTNNVLSTPAFSNEVHKGMMGTLTGTVTDFGTGAPVAGVNVTAGTYSGTTNASGVYSFGVYQGTHTVTGTKLGYQPFSQANVSVTGLLTTTLNFQLVEIAFPPANVVATEAVDFSNVVVNWQAPDPTAPVVETFETGNFNAFAWVLGGTTPWFVANTGAHQGTYCAQSGDISASQTSSIEITRNVLVAGNVSFWYSVSSESNYDKLNFYIDGVQQGSWSGTVGWTQASYPLTLGTHVLKWAYSKDGSVDVGSDCAWIDDIAFPASTGTAAYELGKLFSSAKFSEVSDPKSSNLTITKADDASRTIVGYKVWRLLAANEGNEATWTSMTPNPITALTYTDSAWQPLPSGVYKFAIKAVYTNNVLSNPALSNAIHKGMMGVLTGNVTEFGTSVPIEGATVTAGEYHGTTNASGVYSFSVYQNTYEVTCAKVGYQTATQAGVNITGLQTTNLNFVLTELTLPPAAVQATEASPSTVNIVWMAPGTGGGEWIHYDSGENDNSIGLTNGGDLLVAIRYPASALADYAGMSLQAIALFPADAGTFSLRVWTGGTPTAPGTQVVDQPFTVDTVDAYQTVVLTNPVAISGSEELWFGYNVTHAAGTLPAGVDAGPCVNGFGNMLYNSGAWASLYDLVPDFDYNWNIQGYVGYSPPTTAVAITDPIARMTPNDQYGSRTLTGYKVWRFLQGQENNEPAWNLLTPNPISATGWQDTGWGGVPDGNYRWSVKAIYTGGALSLPAFSNMLPKFTQIGTIAGIVRNMQNAPIMGATVTCGTISATTNASGAYSMQVGSGTHSVTASHPNYASATQNGVIVVTGQTTTVNFQLANSENLLSDGFETYENFALTFAPWTTVDLDLSNTYTMQGTTWLNSGTPQAFIIYNPSATTPASTTIVPHGGAKMAACVAATTPPNNDWLITPQLTGYSRTIKFWAKSLTAQYGLERFFVGVSTTGTAPENFTVISGANYVQTPVEWTEYTYSLAAYSGPIYVGIHCVSSDAWMFYVDDVLVTGTSVDSNDPNAPVLTTELHSNFPNPFNPETTISYSVKEAGPVTVQIYNVKGQLVKNLVSGVQEAGNHSVIWNGKDNNGRAASSGVYFYKMNAGKYSSTKKMIMMK